VRAIRSERPELCRFECRRPGADANPYLALAAIAASAADGCGVKRHRLNLWWATPTRDDLTALPGSLERAGGVRGGRRPASRPGRDVQRYYATSRRWG
jgi:glutamine synthetase